jgi:2-dehydro-3-deoxyphosphogluconate aldolase/(4S)-4-hydroxy-2-oxoglutarate aldolase
MMKNYIINVLLEEKLIVVLRNIEDKYIDQVVESLKSGGGRLFEITLDNERAFEKIERLSKDKDLFVGAGTVIDNISCKMAIDSGAKFIVTPVVNMKVIDICKSYGVPAIIGAMTPTEIFQAYKAGADIVKVFPAGNLGSSYIKNLRGPLTQIPIMVTGGINSSNIVEFKKQGVEMFGIGSSLVSEQTIYEGNFKKLEEEMDKYIQLIR